MVFKPSCSINHRYSALDRGNGSLDCKGKNRPRTPILDCGQAIKHDGTSDYPPTELTGSSNYVLSSTTFYLKQASKTGVNYSANYDETHLDAVCLI